MARRYQVIFDDSAYADLADIKAYLANARDEAFATDFVTRVVRYCQSFRTVPHRGSRLTLDGVSLQTVTWRRSVTVAFQVLDEAQRVVVLGVFYRGRNVRAALRQRLED